VSILNLGDPHIVNEVNDKYKRVLEWISTALKSFNIYTDIDNINILGDVMDCEYITYRKLLYFYNFINNIKDEFKTNNVRIIVGNHDKYSKTDSISSNLLRHLYYNGEVISSITLKDGVLYIPHFYDKTQADFSNINNDDVNLIIAHIGSKEIFGENELTVEYLRDNIGFKNQRIITGHLHNIKLDYLSKNYYIGSLKADSFNEFSTHFSISYIDNNGKYFFLLIPYLKIFLTFDVYNNKKFKEDLFSKFKEIELYNKTFNLIDDNGVVLSMIDSEQYLTTNISIKTKLHVDDIKKKDIDLIVEQCRHELDDPSFMNIKIKTFINIDSLTRQTFKDESKVVVLDNKKIEEGRDKLKKLIEVIKEGPLSNQRKVKKTIDSITDKELDLFVEYLITSKKDGLLDDLCSKSI